MAYTLSNGRTITARPGQYVHCDCFGRFLRIVDSLTNGLGLNYQAKADGTLVRVIF